MGGKPRSWRRRCTRRSVYGSRQCRIACATFAASRRSSAFSFGCLLNRDSRQSAFIWVGDKDKTIICLPHVLRPRPVAAQPQHPLDAAYIEAVREVVVVSEYRRRDRDRAGGSLVSPHGLARRAFGLIAILQSQMRPQLKRAETKTELTGSRIELGAGGAAWEAEIADRQLDRWHGVRCRRRRDSIPTAGNKVVLTWCYEPAAGDGPGCPLAHHPVVLGVRPRSTHSSFFIVRHPASRLSQGGDRADHLHPLCGLGCPQEDRGRLLCHAGTRRATAVRDAHVRHHDAGPAGAGRLAQPQGVTHVAFELTGEFWKPVYNILEAVFTIMVANAQHIKNVPGRKTDVQDAAWIADLLRHGLLQASFIPPLPQRDLRDLTRQRTNLVRERAEVANQLHKVLEWANIKLTSVITDIKGDSARAMLAAIVWRRGRCGAAGRVGHRPHALETGGAGAGVDRARARPSPLFAGPAPDAPGLSGRADRAVQRSRSPPRSTPRPESVSGPPPPDGAQRRRRRHRADGDEAAPQRPVDWARAVELLVTIPGVGRTTAELLIAEVGTDMARFGSAARLASWAKVCPGNNESAGKRYSGRTGHGNAWLRSGLVQAAHSAVVVKDSYFAKVYRRLRVRRGGEARDDGGGASAADGGVPHVAQARAVSGAGTERAGRAAQAPVGPPYATALRALRSCCATAAFHRARWCSIADTSCAVACSGAALHPAAASASTSSHLRTAAAWASVLTQRTALDVCNRRPACIVLPPAGIAA